ncbi:MAG TPA: ABC transporter permease [Vicinamibacterales bacterium]|jgi:ABC-type antimicrobial peptide transport system permease subunit|nr:ABC transporter permease [Vicinamibacterales bacterium]
MPLLITSIRLAVRALRRNAMRTLLTMLGMIIGVGAVVTMVALGNGAQQSVETDVRSAGTNLIHVKAGNFTRGGEESNIATGLGSATTLVVSDADAIAHEVAGVKYESPEVRLRGWMSAGTERFYGQMLGTNASYGLLYNWTFVRGGRFFQGEDVTSHASVAVIGTTVRDRLFGEGVNPVGRTVTIRDRPFTVVGVTRTTDEDQTETVFVPYTTLQDVLSLSYLHSITVEAGQAGDASQIAADVTALLRKRHAPHINEAVASLRRSGVMGNQMPGAGGGAGAPDDFTVKTQASEALTKGLYTSVAAFVLANMPKLDEVNLQEMNSTLQRAGTTMTALLAGIAAISLVVGGIGIMNIMLVSVTERTREIGIRRAIGARARDVLLQFLVEALTLSMVGGAVGLVVGFVASGLLTWVLEWPTAVSPSAVGLAFGIAAAVGIFFGFYPARRASQLTPIDALRHE